MKFCNRMLVMTATHASNERTKYYYKINNITNALFLFLKLYKIKKETSAARISYISGKPFKKQWNCNK